MGKFWTDEDRTEAALRRMAKREADGRRGAALSNRHKSAGWTPERQQMLEDLISRGNTAAQAARALGKTRNACIGRANRTGLRFDGYPKERGREARITRGDEQPVTLSRKSCENHSHSAQEDYGDTLAPVTDERPPRASQCKFIFNDDMTPGNAQYCQNAKGRDANGLPRPSYCNEHHKLTHTQVRVNDSRPFTLPKSGKISHKLQK